jgi:hypothetical protein
LQVAEKELVKTVNPQLGFVNICEMRRDKGEDYQLPQRSIFLRYLNHVNISPCSSSWDLEVSYEVATFISTITTFNHPTHCPVGRWST